MIPLRLVLLGTLGAMAAALFTVGAATVLALRIAHWEALLPRWAERNGYRILKKEQRISRYSLLYHVTVQDQEGKRRSGLVEFGPGVFGCLFSDKVKVRWDE